MAIYDVNNEPENSQAVKDQSNPQAQLDFGDPKPAQPRIRGSGQDDTSPIQQGQKKPGLISRIAQSVWDNRDKIGDVMTTIGSAMSAAAYGGSGGQYGQAWADTAQGIKEQHQRDLEKQRQQHEQGLETLGVQHDQGLQTLGVQQDFQAGQSDLDRQAQEERQRQAEKAASDLSAQGARQNLTSQSQAERAASSLSAQGARQNLTAQTQAEKAQSDLQTKQFEHNLEALGIQGDQAKELVELQGQIQANLPSQTATAVRGYLSDMLGELKKANPNKSNTEIAQMAKNEMGNMAVLLQSLEGVRPSMGEAQVNAVNAAIEQGNWTAAAQVLGAINPVKALTDMFRYSSGGFTGPGRKNEPAGIVHKGEYVIPKEGVNQKTGLPYPEYVLGKKKQRKKLTTQDRLSRLERWSGNTSDNVSTEDKIRRLRGFLATA